MRKKKPKLYNGFASKKYIIRLMIDYYVEEYKKECKHKHKKRGEIWNARKPY